MSFTCPKCDAESFDRLKYCPDCGFDFSAAQKKCPRCRSLIHVDEKICPECDLDFEQYSYFIPRLVVFSIVGLLILILVVSPWVWKMSPGLHAKGEITDGYLRSGLQGQALVPMFIHWRSGVRYIYQSRQESGFGDGSDYMNQLIPLPPEVVFHYDVPAGERVWIIRWKKDTEGQKWAQVGRWRVGPDKYGWVHETNLRIEE